MSSGTKNFGSSYNLNSDMINPTFDKLNNLLGFINQNQNDKNLLNNVIYGIVKTIPLIFGIKSETQNFDSYTPQKQAYFDYLLITGLNAIDHIISLILYVQELENPGSSNHINYFSLILKVVKGSLDLTKTCIIGTAINLLKVNNLDVPAPFYATLIESALDFSILAISTFGSDIVSSLVYWIALIITGIYSLLS